MLRYQVLCLYCYTQLNVTLSSALSVLLHTAQCYVIKCSVCTVTHSSMLRYQVLCLYCYTQLNIQTVHTIYLIMQQQGCENEEL